MYSIYFYSYQQKQYIRDERIFAVMSHLVKYLNPLGLLCALLMEVSSLCTLQERRGRQVEQGLETGFDASQ
jgi:hypothetical protein